MRYLLPLVGFAAAAYAQTCNTTVTSTSAKILVIASDATNAANGYLGLQGYGIPYEVLTVPSTGASLPALNSSGLVGNYGGFIILSEVVYNYTTGFASALTTAQWQQLYDYQTHFGVRMVRLDVYPGINFGTATAAASGEGCCAAGVEQLISFTNDTSFPTANLVLGAGVSTSGLFHYPATITDPATTWEVAAFDPAGSFSGKTTGAVVNRLPNGSGVREQMVFFMSWAAAWSPTSNYLQHAYIHFLTRGLYAGFRRIYLSTQIDDLHLYTGLYSPNNTDFRISAPDLDFHVAWTADFNSRLPAGSNYFIELGHNGNGNIENATARSLNAEDGLCPENLLIQYGDQVATPLEFQKPLGTGTDMWPTSPAQFSSSIECMRLDPLFDWFLTSSNLNAYAHLSHTYTHLSLNNATFSDVNKEIQFNIAWMAKAGISSASKFSADGLIPPAITGLHNGDAIKAWMDNGIKYVVGDNTRPVLMNQQNPFWPLTSTVADNGYAGLEIIPRWATTIYYNCDLPACTLLEWINTSAGSGDFNNLLLNAKQVNTLHLFGLHWDPFMFHQANLRSDVPQLTINGQTKTYSLLTAWAEVVIGEVTRLTSWPIVTKKHSDIGAAFVDRRTRDQCGYQLAWNYGPDGGSIVGATVSSANACSAPIPVTFPGPVTSTNGGTSEQLGSDPLTVWVTLSGSPVSFTLQNPIPIR